MKNFFSKRSRLYYLLAGCVFIFLLVWFFTCPWLMKRPKIVIYGDSRTQHDKHQKVVDAISKVNPRVVFHTGDLVEDGLKPEQWVIFNEITSDIRESAEFYPVLGNHENNSELYFENFNLPNNERWYTVQIEDIRFILLDSNTDITTDSDQYKWLKSELANTGRDVKFTVILLHQPLFTSQKNHKPKKSLKKSLVPLFEQYKVDVVFSGHSHYYERFLHNGIYYIISGGGGAPLYHFSNPDPESEFFAKKYHFCLLKPEENRLTIEAIDTDMNVIDKVRLASGSR